MIAWMSQTSLLAPETINSTSKAGAFLEIEAGGCRRQRCPRAVRADEIYAPALINPVFVVATVISNADCACSIGRGHDCNKEPALPM